MMNKIQVQEELERIEEQCTKWEEVEKCYASIFKKIENIGKSSVAEFEKKNSELESENWKLRALKRKWGDEIYAKAKLRTKLRKWEHKRDEVEEIINVLEYQKKNAINATTDTQKVEMAATFSDLHTESGLKSLDQFLSGKTYISGDELTKDDIKVYASVLEKPSESFPHAAKWYEVVSSHLAPSFPGTAQGVKFSGKSAPAEAAPAKSDAPAEDDDDLDLFGDETEEDKKAAEEREAAKKPAKKKESGKSSVLLDVKPWDDETDMKKLEETVRSIELPGLLWGASKLVPVGYGIKKLQIMMTIVDDLVSVDTLIEERLTVEPCNEYIQSCDIVAFNKI
ncbi:hypothetical protein Lal_00048681 [Lupinus albus]|uniref:Putative translation elongation factor EF1B/ribosomal protein S6 n=1 Tax=Lupinus albus TaxID=3870 RepID=A0A6A5LRN5_LUPAL|nr:putative translation elongation factor EF1B/ribosomal protein S6 [Lupinus albus]KAF1864116.1 hypothetical protein Lal_00048681 [Lupinus albus]